ncbi:MAG: DNA replication protein [Alicyclobacillus sp. RIFOXYA1_FULL_53_8]|nr:MAG: DNA replication protein [Alicyclobacillus sp. RIFOXYA1_FULL_53_8]
MQHIKAILPKSWREQADSYDVPYFRRVIPALQSWNVSDSTVERHRAMLLEYLRQEDICKACQGYLSCPKEGDMRGFTQNLEVYGSELTVRVNRCQPYQEEQLRRRLQRWNHLSGSLEKDESFQFANFPLEQRQRYPRLLQFAEEFADTFEVGQTGAGLYIFGPPGVGKTHLLLAVLNRLKDRGVPSMFVRSDSIFDRMRHIIADNGDLEPLLEAYATAPILGIDEFAQERANDFTLEKLFRIINQRFHAQLPTWFTSNYAPVHIYRKNGVDLNDSVAPLRSRIMQMAKLAKVDGDDWRQRFLESLT